MPAQETVPDDATCRKARHRRRIAIILSTLILLVIGPYVVSKFVARGRQIRVRSLSSVHESPRLDQPSELRVISYNIAHGRGTVDDNWQEPGVDKRNRISQIAQFLEQTNTDVVVLNEVDFDSTWSGHQNQAATLAQEAGFPYWVEQRNLDFRFIYGSWKFGNAILSKYPIREAHVIDFPPHSAWEDWLVGCKRGVVCTVELPDRRRVLRSGGPF